MATRFEKMKQDIFAAASMIQEHDKFSDLTEEQIDELYDYVYEALEMFERYLQTT